jgi:hypothetical protein
MGTSDGGKDRIGLLPESGDMIDMTNGISDGHDVTLFEAGEVDPSIPSVRNEHNSGEVQLSAHSMESKIK